jgi:hypothetical protein
VEGTTAGAATGGVIGGVIGGLVSMGSPSYIAQGAIIGAQVGGHGGYAYATSVANKKARYASEEVWLDACIAEARETTEKSVAYNQLARQIIARQTQDIPKVLKTAAIKPESRQRAAEIRKLLDTSLTNLNLAIQSWDGVLKAHRELVEQNRGNPKFQGLTRQVEELQKGQDELHQDYDSFTTLRKELGP